MVLWRSRESNLRPLVYKANFFVAFLGINQFRWVGLRFVLVFITRTPKGSPKVVLWRSRESNLQPLVYKAAFCGFPGYKPVPPGWFKICAGFITGTPKAHRMLFSWRSWESNLRPLVYKAKKTPRRLSVSNCSILKKILRL